MARASVTRWRSGLTSLGAAACVALLGGGARAEAQAPEDSQPRSHPQLSCYQLAQSGGLSDENSAAALCQGATSTAPARCFLRVEDEGSLSDAQAVALCQYATAEDDPASCFLEATEQSSIEDWRAVRLCQPAMAQSLNNCPAVVY